MPTVKVNTQWLRELLLRSRLPAPKREHVEVGRSCESRIFESQMVRARGRSGTIFEQRVDICRLFVQHGLW